MAQLPQDEIVVLNVGGTKYETLRSTLAAHPNTLLGSYFCGSDRALPKLAKGNELFFNRNGRAFYYILEWYRTGHLFAPELLTLNHTATVKCEELEAELDYFRIPPVSVAPPRVQRRQFKSDERSAVVAARMAETVDGFVSALGFAVREAQRNFCERLRLCLYMVFRTDVARRSHVPGISRILMEPYLKRAVKAIRVYDAAAFPIMEAFGEHIVRKLSKDFAHCDVRMDRVKPDNHFVIDVVFKVMPDWGDREKVIKEKTLLDF